MAFRVQGGVQGVGYRRFAQREAQALGLAGWVRNEADGSVSGEAEGNEADLATLRNRLGQGPGYAAVERLDWEPLAMGHSLPFPFTIHR